MKSSDTSNSIATTGLGQRLDIEPEQWFMARVGSRDLDADGFYIYSLGEYEPNDDEYGYRSKQAGLSVTTCQEVNNARVPIGTIVLARFRAWKSTTPTYEFWASVGSGDADGSGSGGEPGNDLTTITIGPFVTGVSVECVTNSGGVSELVTTVTYGTQTITGVDLSAGPVVAYP